MVEDSLSESSSEEIIMPAENLQVDQSEEMGFSEEGEYESEEPLSMSESEQ